MSKLQDAIFLRSFFAVYPIKIMSLTTPYYQQKSDSIIEISTPQASDFAKKIAHDFNPIHDTDSKRFCVSGDLIFAISLAKYGLFSKTVFSFDGLVAKNSPLHFPKWKTGKANIQLPNKKTVASLAAETLCSKDSLLIDAFIQAYVRYSGQNFPDLLLPLMQKHQVMINPQRPLVIYKEMSFDLECGTAIQDGQFHIHHLDSEMHVENKRAEVVLHFSIESQQKNCIGKGRKLLLLSGMQPYDENTMRNFCAAFAQAKEEYLHA